MVRVVIHSWQTINKNNMQTKMSMMFALLLAGTLSYSQHGPRLIIRGDDMGYSHSGNEAILKAYTEGIETSIEVIVPSPWFPGGGCHAGSSSEG